MTLRRGDTILVPVEVGVGPFTGESLITFDTKDGPVSGFITHSEIRQDHGHDAVEAEVLDVTSETVTVRLRGSFFTTTGLAYLSSGTGYRKVAA